MKIIEKFTIDCKSAVGTNTLLTLRPARSEALADIRPGQFVQVKVDGADVLLRRPISICDVTSDGRLVLLVKAAGRATDRLVSFEPGEQVDIILPLGNGFDINGSGSRRVLLVGGGVGVAPLVMLSKALISAGDNVTVAIGTRSVAEAAGVLDIFPDDAFKVLATDDGTAGEKGLVTQSSAFAAMDYDIIYVCGPTPMMKAVAAIARERGIACQVSLENMMACGLGACLCCVEKTVKGNVCVCTEGPVFEISQLTWK